MADTGRLSEVRTDGLVLDVVDTGPIDGDPVVLLHGFPQRPSSWEGVSAVLHEHGLRTLALDQRGYAPRARPKSRFAYGLPSLRGDVLALVTALGKGPVHLVGHDWGAAVAWSFAAHEAASVRTLTAVSVPHPAAFLSSMTSSTQALHSTYMLAFQLPWLPEKLLSSRRGDRLLTGFGMTPDMVERFHREVAGSGALRGGLGYYRSLPAGLRSGEIGRRVSVPTTYVWSDRDIALGRRCAELCADWVTGPYAFEVMTGVSHWIPEQRPDELAAIVVQRVRS